MMTEQNQREMQEEEKEGVYNETQEKEEELMADEETEETEEKTKEIKDEEGSTEKIQQEEGDAEENAKEENEKEEIEPTEKDGEEKKVDDEPLTANQEETDEEMDHHEENEKVETTENDEDVDTTNNIEKKTIEEQKNGEPLTTSTPPANQMNREENVKENGEEAKKKLEGQEDEKVKNENLNEDQRKESIPSTTTLTIDATNRKGEEEELSRTPGKLSQTLLNKFNMGSPQNENENKNEKNQGDLNKPTHEKKKLSKDLLEKFNLGSPHALEQQPHQNEKEMMPNAPLTVDSTVVNEHEDTKAKTPGKLADGIISMFSQKLPMMSGTAPNADQHLKNKKKQEIESPSMIGLATAMKPKRKKRKGKQIRKFDLDTLENDNALDVGGTDHLERKNIEKQIHESEPNIDHEQDSIDDEEDSDSDLATFEEADDDENQEEEENQHQNDAFAPPPPLDTHIDEKTSTNRKRTPPPLPNSPPPVHKLKNGIFSNPLRSLQAYPDYPHINLGENDDENRDSMELSPVPSKDPTRNEHYPTQSDDYYDLTVITSVTDAYPQSEISPSQKEEIPSSQIITPRRNNPFEDQLRALDTNYSEDFTESDTTSLSTPGPDFEYDIEAQIQNFADCSNVQSSSKKRTRFSKKLKVYINIEDYLRKYLKYFPNSLIVPASQIKIRLSKKKHGKLVVICDSNSQFIKNKVVITQTIKMIKRDNIYIRVPESMDQHYLKYTEKKLLSSDVFAANSVMEFSKTSPGVLCVTVIATELYFQMIMDYCHDKLVEEIKIRHAAVATSRLESLMNATHPRQESLKFLKIPFNDKKDLVSSFKRQFNIDFLYSFECPKDYNEKKLECAQHIDSESNYTYLTFFESPDEYAEDAMAFLELLMGDEDEKEILLPDVEHAYYLFERYPKKYKNMLMPLKMRLTEYAPVKEQGIRLRGPSKFVDYYRDYFHKVLEGLKKSQSVKRIRGKLTPAQIDIFRKTVHHEITKLGVRLEYVNMSKQNFYELEHQLDIRLTKCNDMLHTVEKEIYETIKPPFSKTCSWEYQKNQEWKPLHPDLQLELETRFENELDVHTSKVEVKKKNRLSAVLSKAKIFTYNFESNTIKFPKDETLYPLRRVVNTERQWVMVEGYRYIPFYESLNDEINRHYPRSFVSRFSDLTYEFNFNSQIVTINNSESKFQQVTPPGVTILQRSQKKKKKKSKKHKKNPNSEYLYADRSYLKLKIYYSETEQAKAVTELNDKFKKSLIVDSMNMNPQYLPMQLHSLTNIASVDLEVNMKSGDINIKGDQKSIDHAKTTIMRINRYIGDYPFKDPRISFNTEFNPNYVLNGNPEVSSAPPDYSYEPLDHVDDTSPHVPTQVVYEEEENLNMNASAPEL